ncbi:hypothetical protein BOTBODRAFT_538249 [Botryobasidium botryosum FD-172 SS1]|uniref:Uncharacterized protein n=1 Tax=Botryobasidium botryosum (strain FD-172 SS1) TaxID=930990 RepID=A0A067LZY5_BOTB1|nr:hypothetical protein BOTBODRAFT_538249 [Botryobasidium botryosum FD-172 SS1]
MRSSCPHSTSCSPSACTQLEGSSSKHRYFIIAGITYPIAMYSVAYYFLLIIAAFNCLITFPPVFLVVVCPDPTFQVSCSSRSSRAPHRNNESDAGRAISPRFYRVLILCSLMD